MRRLPIVTALALLLAACGSGDGQQPPAELPVSVIKVTEQRIPNIIELPGRVEPVRTAEVRARVTGILERRLYEEGTDVAPGQPLFRIDPRELQASHAQTQAALQRARATAANANAVVGRYRPLVKENAISQQEYDAAVAAAREADANVAQISAQLRSSALQLGYTTVRSPIAGRASRAQVTEGALVSATEATLLTKVEQSNPIYVTFAQSSRRLMEIRRAIADGTLALGSSDSIEVRLTFEDGTPYAIPGRIDFLDFSVDESTGTVVLRAEFANPQRLLLPGQFVRATLAAGERKDGIMLPQRVVILTDKGGSVFVVDAEGKAVSRPVQLGQAVGDAWIIESGLKAGDVVIASNLQKLRPGAPVKIVAGAAKNAPAAKAASPKPAGNGNR